MTHSMPIRAHEQLLRQMIKNQAGTVEKALSELLSNSIDAIYERRRRAAINGISIEPGSETIHLTLSRTGFSIIDNGAGFDSREQIESVFATFGTPHEVGDAVFGQFRIGRGQAFTNASTEWKSNGHKMVVDIKAALDDPRLPLHFLYEELDPPVAGCEVVGTWYRLLSRDELFRLSRTIRETVPYSPITIYLDVEGDYSADEPISKNPASLTWDVETDQYYIKWRKSGGVSVYNKGVFVRNYAHLGHAIVVSKATAPQFKVNFARNDIHSDCPMWREIIGVLQKHIRKTAEHSPSLSEEERESLARQFRDQEISYGQAHDFKLLTDVTGRHVRIGTLFNQTKISVAPAGHDLARIVHQRKLAWVFSKITLERFGVETLEELIQLLTDVLTQQGVSSWYLTKLAALVIVPLEQLTTGINTDFIFLKDRELTEKEKAAHRAIADIQESLCDFLNTTSIFHQKRVPRSIIIGMADFSAWTDGETYIALHRLMLKHLSHGLAGAMQLIYLLTERYLTDEADNDTTETTPLLQQLFIDVITYGTVEPGTATLTKFGQRLLVQYDSWLKRMGIANTKAIRNGLDTIDDHPEATE